MPVISTFYGILIYMYFFDEERHHKPHIHAKYSDQEAVIEIPSGTVLAGTIKKSKLKLIQAWIEIHQDDGKLEFSRKGHTISKIAPLK